MNILFYVFAIRNGIDEFHIAFKCINKYLFFFLSFFFFFFFLEPSRLLPPVGSSVRVRACAYVSCHLEREVKNDESK